MQTLIDFPSGVAIESLLLVQWLALFSDFLHFALVLFEYFSESLKSYLIDSLVGDQTGLIEHAFRVALNVLRFGEVLGIEFLDVFFGEVGLGGTFLCNFGDLFFDFVFRWLGEFVKRKYFQSVELVVELSRSVREFTQNYETQIFENLVSQRFFFECFVHRA